MSARHLPDVTVVVIDCAAHTLTALALRDTLAQIDPAEVLVFSDQPGLAPSGAHHIYCDHDSREAAFETLWSVVPRHITTTHMLKVEWDGWVLDGSAWDPAWLETDYIGAPWPWHKDRFRVGNGGFSLRSRDLMKHLARFGYAPTHPEDDTLCRQYRPGLEFQGFVWANEESAARFSLEHGPIRRTFGFHDCRNWPRLLSADALRERLEVANDYVRTNIGWMEMASVLGTLAA